jgi:cytosine/uracil/thiamine/allantoin permease
LLAGSTPTANSGARLTAIAGNFVVEKIGNPVVVAIGSITFIVATMGINIVANFVSPAYDIANLCPQKINFRLGGLITSILSVLVCPTARSADGHQGRR